eukprot:117800-Amphidinium_carterae.2
MGGRLHEETFEQRIAEVQEEAHERVQVMHEHVDRVARDVEDRVADAAARHGAAKACAKTAEEMASAANAYREEVTCNIQQDQEIIVRRALARAEAAEQALMNHRDCVVLELGMMKWDDFYCAAVNCDCSLTKRTGQLSSVLPCHPAGCLQPDSHQHIAHISSVSSGSSLKPKA